MHRGKYLVYDSLNMQEPDGIEKKILKQCELFFNYEIEMSFLQLKRKNDTFWNYEDKFAGIDLIYFRKSTVIDWRFLRYFRRLKHDYPSIIIVMEIPTFPYEGEYGQGIRSKMAIVIDHIYRMKLSGLIDFIVVTGADVGNMLWNIHTISIVNGIDVREQKVSNRIPQMGLINIGCIAKFSPWHGYERIIEGLKRYYCQNPKPRIRVDLIMVGDGVEKNHYEQLADEYGLVEHVRFTGQLLGDALDKIYDEIDIGCCSLGRYKSGIQIIGDLKSREFMAKGIPMILGCEIDVLKGIDFKFSVRFPNDETPIDIDRVVSSCINISLSMKPEDVKKSIRETAFDLVDIHHTFLPVLECVKNALNEKAGIENRKEDLKMDW